MREHNGLQGWTTPLDRVSYKCADMIVEELNERGIMVGIDKIVITQGPTNDGKVLELMRSGVLEHDNVHTVAQLVCTLIVSGYHLDKPEEKVYHLIVGKYRTAPYFLRLGHYSGKNSTVLVKTEKESYV